MGPDNVTYCVSTEWPPECYATYKEAEGTLTTTTTTEAPKYTRLADPNITHRQYQMYESSGDVLHLQMMLDLATVDGIYGPVTRTAHMEFLGGASAAVYIFFPEFGRTPVPCHADCLPGDSHYELPTLGELVDRYFLPEDHAWALRVAFCESSAKPSDTGSIVVSSALAVGWFQHLARYWVERSAAAGWADHDIFHAEANVAVAAWLFYEGGGARHWNPSRSCWE